MRVFQLSRHQLDQLKEAQLVNLFEAQSEYPTYGELVDSCNISDEQIFAAYSLCEFSDDDFA